MRKCNSLVGKPNLLGVREGKLASAHVCGLRWNVPHVCRNRNVPRSGTCMCVNYRSVKMRSANRGNTPCANWRSLGSFKEQCGRAMSSWCGKRAGTILKYTWLNKLMSCFMNWLEGPMSKLYLWKQCAYIEIETMLHRNHNQLKSLCCPGG